MTSIKVLLTLDFEPEHLAKLQAVSDRLELHQVHASNASKLPAHLLAEVQVLYTLGAFPSSEQAPALQWIQLHSAGSNHVPPEVRARPGLRITTSSGIHATPIAEYVMATMLALRRRLCQMRDLQDAATWPRARWELFAVPELRGQAIGIVGYGSIGREVARLADALGMTVLATRHRPGSQADKGWRAPGTGDPQGALPARWFGPDQLPELLAASDVVVIALPLTAETHHLVDAQALAAMRPDSMFINIARGAVVDEPALIEALQEGRIGAAALDVFETEPLPSSSPLWAMNNVLVTPHISGASPKYDDRASDLFADNLRRYLAGEPLFNLVQPA